MKDKLFDSKPKIEKAISDFANMLEQSGWQLFEAVMDSNIEVVTRLIVKGINLEGEKATEEETNRLRDKLTVYEEAKNTPRRLIKRYSETGGDEDPNPDPYPTVDELKEGQSE